MNKRLRTILQYLFFLGLGIFFVWLSLKNLTSEKTGQIKSALQNAKHWLIFPVFGILIASHITRALRWRLLIEPLDYRPSRVNTFFAVMTGYLVNQGVPRLGELIKCTLLARYEKIPVDKLIGTVIVERLVDAFSFLTILGITLAIQPGIYSQLIHSLFSNSGGEASKQLSFAVFALLILAVLVLIIAVWMIRKKKNFADLASVLKKIGRSIWQGFTTVRRLKKRRLFILFTILLWALYLSAGYIGFFAFRETSGYGIREAFTVLSAGSIGMIASPGGIGAYAYLVQKTMPVYGLNAGAALAFGWILWLVTTAVIVIGGLISFAIIPYYNKSRRVEKS